MSLRSSILAAVLLPFLMAQTSPPVTPPPIIPPAAPALSQSDQALIAACLNGQTQALQAALKQGANLELHYGPRALTPLMLSLYRDNREQVALLLAAGADSNARNLRGFTPLMITAGGGQVELAGLLLQYGARVDAVDEEGNSALHWAAYWGHPHLIQLLIQAGAQLNRRNQAGNSVLMLAASGNLEENAYRQLRRHRQFAPNGRLLSAPSEPPTPLGLKLLLQAGADPNLANQAGETPLMIYASRGARSAVFYLLAAGAQAGLKNHKGESAADYARKSGENTLGDELDIFAQSP